MASILRHDAACFPGMVKIAMKIAILTRSRARLALSVGVMSGSLSVALRAATCCALQDCSCELEFEVGDLVRACLFELFGDELLALQLLGKGRIAGCGRCWHDIGEVDPNVRDHERKGPVGQDGITLHIFLDRPGDVRLVRSGVYKSLHLLKRSESLTGRLQALDCLSKLCSEGDECGHVVGLDEHLEL